MLKILLLDLMVIEGERNLSDKQNNYTLQKKIKVKEEHNGQGQEIN